MPVTQLTKDKFGIYNGMLYFFKKKTWGLENGSVWISSEHQGRGCSFNPNNSYKMPGMVAQT